MEAHLKRLLLDLRERLSEALAESPEVTQTLDELRKNGYAVQLLMDCKRESRPGESETSVTPRPAPVEPVAFRINSQDLNFLRSLGIDPTKTTRGLRQRKKALRQLPGKTDPDKQLPPPAGKPAAADDSEPHEG